MTSSVDFNLKVWDVSTGTEKFTLTGHMSGINAMAYSVCSYLVHIKEVDLG